MSLVSLQASYQKPVLLNNYLTYANLSNFIALKSSWTQQLLRPQNPKGQNL